MKSGRLHEGLRALFLIGVTAAWVWAAFAGCSEDGAGSDTGQPDLWLPTTDPGADGGASGAEIPTNPDGATPDPGPGDSLAADPGEPEDTSQPPDHAGVDLPSNTPPTFDTPPTVTVQQGGTSSLDLNPYIADAEDPDELLTVEASALHVATLDPGDHQLQIKAPTDWYGTEEVDLTVTDSDGASATATLTVVVEQWVPPGPVCGEVTFSYQAAAGVSQVLLSGSFNGWGDNPASAEQLSDPDGDGTWEVTLVLDPGTYLYKFIVDGAWIADPSNPNTVPDGYGGDNSVVVVPPCEEPPPTDGCKTLFSYDAELGVSQVLLSGSFNGWGDSPATADVMLDGDGDGIWEIALELEPGIYQYKFIVDGAWIPDPTNPNQAPDGVGGQNSVVTVPDCSSGAALTLTWHDTDQAAQTFSATLQTVGKVAITPSDVEVTVDHAPAPAGSVTQTPDGTGLGLDLALTPGIHDVRVEHEGGTMLLKVYLGVSTDWRDAVLYFAMTDRFANGDPTNDAPIADVDGRTNYQGGDFAGITAKLQQGYFDDLGVGALWISWPVDNPDHYEDGSRPAEHACGLDPKTMALADMRYTGYHGYWPSDLDEVDEHFGTLDELQQLVVEAHSRGIRVLLDFTANHVHDSSPFFAAHQDDGYFNLPAEVCQDVGWDSQPKTCWFTDYLPDLDYNNPAARAAVVKHAIEWVKLSGADGFRFDAVKHLEMSFVQQLRAATAAELELTGVDFYIVGETFSGDPWLISSFIGADKIHGQFDFPANKAMLEGFASVSKGLDVMDGEIRAAKATYGPSALMSTFIGNHDIARFVSLAAGQIYCGIWDVVSNIAQGWLYPPDTPADEAPYRKLRLAFAYAYTIPGVPLIYYGDEFGMPGAGDPDNRRFMLFGDELTQYQQDTLTFMQALGAARQAHPSLSRGDWTAQLWAEADFLAFGRTLPEEQALILINRGTSNKMGELDVDGLQIPNGTSFMDVVGGGGSVTIADGALAFDVPGVSVSVFVSQ